FTGPPSRIRELRRKLQRRLVQVAVALTVPEERQNDSSYRNSVRIEAANIPVPPGVMAIVAEEGNTIPYTVHRLPERLLPVRLDYAGEARLSQVKVEPATVMVRGPKDILDRIWSLSTQPYVLPSPPDALGGNTLVRGQVSLVSELEGRPLQVTPKSVSFSFHVKPKQKVFELKRGAGVFLVPAEFCLATGLCTRSNRQGESAYPRPGRRGATPHPRFRRSHQRKFQHGQKSPACSVTITQGVSTRRR